MTTSRKSTFAALFCAAAVAVVLAGCGSSNDNTTASNSTQGSNASQSKPDTSVAAGTISTGSTPAGTVLVGEGGRTLYLFEADKHGKSSCSGGCATAWPPAMASGSAKATGDAQMSMVSTVSRSDGGKQLVYAGHPLYFFEGDKQAGTANGNGVDGFGAEWYALTPSGKNAEESGGDKSSSSDSSMSNDSSSSSSSGY